MSRGSINRIRLLLENICIDPLKDFYLIHGVSMAARGWDATCIWASAWLVPFAAAAVADSWLATLTLLSFHLLI